MSAGFTYEDGMAQFGETADRSVLRAYNDPHAPLGEQAAVASATTSDFLTTQVVDMLRFNSLAVAYSVPASLAQRVGARSLTVALQGTNLGLHTNFRGKDPDTNGQPFGNGTTAGLLPQPRTWQVRVSASY